MNLAVVSRNVGIALICNAAFMFLSAIVSALYGFDSSFSPLLLSALITFIFGIFPLIFVNRRSDINTREGLSILLLSWVLCCIFGMLPYVLWGGEFTLVNAWFESASGITTTGATILDDIEALPHGLLFWRSSTHYMGGLGVVVFIMMILPSFGSVRFKMSKMEIMDVSRSNYKYVSNKLVRVVVTVYLLMTLAATISLLIAGMPLFDAVNHAFSVVATGGFSTRNLSIAAYDSPAIEFVLSFFMILASLHFGLIYASFATRSPKVLRDPVTKFYLTTILVAGLLISVNLFASGTVPSLIQSFRSGFFQTISMISTTGFAISDTSVWPVFSLLILVYVAIQCGCSGSTTSGLRSDRVWILFNSAKAQIEKMANPNAVVQVKSGGVTIDRELLSSVSMLTIIYLSLVMVCAMIYSLFGFDFVESMGTSVSMMSNVGPAFGGYGTMANFSLAPSGAKVIMGLQMIVGRLGVYSVLMIVPMLKKRF